jgi:hypothetical protein
MSKNHAIKTVVVFEFADDFEAETVLVEREQGGYVAGRAGHSKNGMHLAVKKAKQIDRVEIGYKRNSWDVVHTARRYFTGQLGFEWEN